MQHLDDDALVTMAQDGNGDAFAELIRRHRPGCLKLAMSILRERDDAEDEVQNACWKAFQHLEQFQRDARFSTWLTRIVVNQCLMRLRQSRRARVLYLNDVVVGDEPATLDLPSREPTPEASMGRSEVAELLHREIRRIPPLLRSVLQMRDLEERPMEEVSRKLGISMAAAKSRLLRARQELQARLEKHCPAPGPAALMA